MSKQFIPQARSDGLVITELDDEILVYDKTNDKAHCLNQSAALVYKYSNGKRNVAEIARLVEKKMGAPANEQTVWFALAKLEKDHLLREDVRFPNGMAGISRREFVKKMGMAAVAVSVPTIVSMTAPQAAFAQSCAGGLAPGAPCTSSSQCSGSCCCCVTAGGFCLPAGLTCGQCA